ncbi:MAG TPA: hypothetical protein VGI81_00885 [Tepidisphaeraceae bacterium]
MSLDAVVYCDCFERNRLRSEPPAEWDVRVDQDGSRTSRENGLDEYLAFEAWNRNACEHEHGILLHHYIGNMAGVGFLRAKLSEQAWLFPFILSRVIYNGIHAGDCIARPEIDRLDSEVQALRRFHSSDRDDEAWLRRFEAQLSELIAASHQAGKPIVF